VTEKASLISKNYFVVEGVCENILEAGNHTIELWVDGCSLSTTDQPTNVVTGTDMNIPSSMHITEVRLSQRLDGGSYSLA